MFVELILPVPVKGTFTYHLPDGMKERAQVGMRVSVPFGKNHTYTGIIVGLSEQAQALQANANPAVSQKPIAVKDVIELLDEKPILRPTQLDLWRWIAHYYMCVEGDVMKAALPAELKPESGAKGVVREDFKPKTKTFVTIVMQEDKMAAFEQLSRSPRQQKLYMALLDKSKALQQDTPIAVAKDELLAASGCSAAVFNELKAKGWCETFEQEVSRLEPALNRLAPCQPLNELTEMQRVAYRDIVKSFAEHDVSLLYGVTSSGKTEVYMHLMEEVIGQRQQVLMMVPEIALTTQLCQRLRRVFGQRMLVYHSKLSDVERVEIWKRMLEPDNGVDIILGVRSSIFLPFEKLGLVIVDEEHEPSYKQQDPAPRYHGRDVAIILARKHGAKVLLGSATPSLESWYSAINNRYGLVRLTERHAGVGLPRITLVSLMEARKNKAMNGPFSPHLLSALRKTLSDGRQAILFQNRRGFAPQIECVQCGWTPRCPRCDVSLTYHKHSRTLSCHYCGYQMPWPAQCPICGNPRLEQLGYGTERIEEKLKEIIPVATPMRMDTDTTGSKSSYERIINDFEEGKSNVLIGTQMVSKGLDFSAVDVVGILNADSLMNYPDFRAHERAFQLMEQVSGRAGRRAGQEGEVLIQCGDIRNRLLRQVVHHDYEKMAETQLADRQKFGYPPFTRLIMIYIKGRYEDRTRLLAEQYAAALRQTFGVRVLGPEQPGISRLKFFYIQQILIKIERDASPTVVRQYLAQIHANMCAQTDEFKQVQFYYDVDPM